MTASASSVAAAVSGRPAQDAVEVSVSTSPPLALTPTQAAALDDPAGWDLHTRWLGEPTDPSVTRHAQTRLLISGIHCAACAGIIEDALMRQPGVVRAEVNGAAERAVVEWQPEAVPLSRLVGAVQAAGYGAYPDDGAQAVEAARRDARDALWRFFVAGFCMMQVMMYATPSYVATLADMSADVARLLRWASWLLSVPVMLFSAKPFLVGAWRSLRERRIGMDVPVALGLVVTFVASSIAAFNDAPETEVYFDSLTMFVAFLLGARWLEGVARRRAARSLDALMRRLPDAVERLDASGRAELVSARALRVGDRVRIQVGQAFAADGVIVSGTTSADESMLSGESLPVPKATGAQVHAGCLNLGAPVEMRVDALGMATRYQRIVELVGEALAQRPRALLSADRWAGPFLWIVLALSALSYGVWHQIDPQRAVWVAVSVLIVTCPCALSLGSPVAYLAAAGRLARDGILMQRLDALEGLEHAQDIIFDKTGTLTQDNLGLARITAGSVDAEDGRDAGAHALARAASLAGHSGHPLSRALVRAAEGQSESFTLSTWRDVREVPGRGLSASTVEPDGRHREWRLGQADWALDGRSEADPSAGPCVVLAQREMRSPEDPGEAWSMVGSFEFDEQLRADAREAVTALARAGLRTHLLSGDRAASVDAMADALGMHSRRAGCTPEDKLAALEVVRAAGTPVVMVGDGINDAPVLARADVSIAMGSAAALAQARADVIVLSNQLTHIVRVRTMARRTMRIVRQNLGWALAYNLACVPLALMGWLPPWAAGIGMAGSSLLVVLNALRLSRG